MSRGYSLRARLVVVMLGVFAFGFAASLASMRFSIHNLVDDLRVRTLQAQARVVLDSVQSDAHGVTVQLPAEWAQVYADASQRFSFTLFDHDRHPIARSANLAAPLTLTADRWRRDGVQFAGVGDQLVLLSVRAPHGATLVVGRRDLSLDTLVDSLFEESYEHIIVLAPFALLAIALLWFIVDRSLRPLARASHEATLVGPGKPEVRLSVDGLSREMLPLVASMNGALERLAHAYATERQLTADAAHELRTPLAVLTLRLQRAQLTGMSDWPAIERELAQMSRLVAQLLDLARKESLARQQTEATLPVINLSRVVREVAAAWVPRLEEQGRSLEVDVPDVASVHARATDLQDVLRNLLENALIHGAGTIRVRVQRAGGVPHTGDADIASLQHRWVIEVSDQGAGVPQGEEEAVFARFHRLKADAPGSGLGLAIVRQVARSHGGDAYVVPGERGHVAVWLPAAESATSTPPRPPRSAEEDSDA